MGLQKTNGGKKETLHAYPLVTRVKYVRMTEDICFSWWTSKWWGIHIQWPQFSQISRQMTVGGKVRFEKDAEMVAAVSTIVLFFFF